MRVLKAHGGITALLFSMQKKTYIMTVKQTVTVLSNIIGTEVDPRLPRIKIRLRKTEKTQETLSHSGANLGERESLRSRRQNGRKDEHSVLEP